MDITIKEIKVIRFRSGPDHVYLTTSLPPSLEGETELTLEFTTPRSRGPEYVKSVFGVDYTLIQAGT